MSSNMYTDFTCGKGVQQWVTCYLQFYESTCASYGFSLYMTSTRLELAIWLFPSVSYMQVWIIICQEDNTAHFGECKKHHLNIQVTYTWLVVNFFFPGHMWRISGGFAPCQVDVTQFHRAAGASSFGQWCEGKLLSER